MALRVPMLLLLSGTFVGGVASTYIVPKLLPDAKVSEAAAAGVAGSTEKAAPAMASASQAESSETASVPQPVKQASATGCKEPVWPYRDRECTGAAEAASSKPERQIRVISTDRDAPSRVPLPAMAQAEKPANPVQTAALSASPAPESAAAPQDVASTEEGTGKNPLGTILPPEKPAFALVKQAAVKQERQEKVAKAEPAISAAPASDRVETTSSTSPAVEPAAAKPRAPAKRQVARVERPRHDMSERIRQARRNFDEDTDTVVQTTTYQYADGRQIVFRSEPQSQNRRRLLAAEAPMPIEPMPHFEPQPRPARDPVLGWLFGQ